MKNKNEFFFGLETEYMLTNNHYVPLWHQDFHFQEIHRYLEEVPWPKLHGDMSFLKIEAPSLIASPYILEGYRLEEEIQVKGIEIRTPVNFTIENCLEDSHQLLGGLQQTLNNHRLNACALSHHPIYSEYQGPQNNRKHDFWQWELTAMTTYGPDINIRPPVDYIPHIEDKELERAINYYIPALTLLTFASPFVNGDLWLIDGRPGQSYRTFKRSLIAPAIEFHANQNHRYEFKTFEMSDCLEDYHAYFLVSLALLLGYQELKGRACKMSRIYEMGYLAQHGFSAAVVERKLLEFFPVAIDTLLKWGFDVQPLQIFIERFQARVNPAVYLIQRYQNHPSLAAILKERSLRPFPDQEKKSLHLGSVN